MSLWATESNLGFSTLFKILTVHVSFLKSLASFYVDTIYKFLASGPGLPSLSVRSLEIDALIAMGGVEAIMQLADMVPRVSRKGRDGVQSRISRFQHIHTLINVEDILLK